MRVNVAVTLCPADMFTWHVPVPEQSPLHPVKVLVPSGVAVRPSNSRYTFTRARRSFSVSIAVASISWS